MIHAYNSRPTVIDIDLDALAHNFFALQHHVGSSLVMPIVKSNAYGHGIVPCAQHLQKIGAQWLGVALLEEGILLRSSGIMIPIAVLGGILGQQIQQFIHYNLDITASSVSKLQIIDQQAGLLRKRARVHLEIDTGIERTGVHYYTAHTLLEAAAATKHCDIVGIFSHFATADEQDTTFARIQLDRFREIIKQAELFGFSHCIKHIASSGAILQVPESHLDMVRPGLLLYGIAPAAHIPNILDVKPVLSLRSRVVYFKVVQSGAGISYGLTWKAPYDTRIVTIPVGYGDGYSRRLGHNGHVLINGKKYPIVGRICMDQFMVNIGHDEVYPGDEVVLIGTQGSESITIQEMTERVADGNPREILTALNIRIPRQYRENQHIVVCELTSTISL